MLTNINFDKRKLFKTRQRGMNFKRENSDTNDTYHIGQKNNSDGAGNHDGITSQFSMSRYSELHI